MEFDRIISLGNTCHPAIMIRCKYFNALNISQEADRFFDYDSFLSDLYPYGAYALDWLQFPTSSLLKILESEFGGFTALENFEIARRADSYRSVLRNKKLGINFVHFDKYIAKADFRDEKQREEIWKYVEIIFSDKISKYDYLVEKTKETFNGDMDILFVLFEDGHLWDDPKVYDEILSLLKKYKCRPRLLVLSDSEVSTEFDPANDELIFRKVDNVRGWHPELEYNSWLDAMDDFSFRGM